MLSKNSLKAFKKLKFSNVHFVKPRETKINYKTFTDLKEWENGSLYFEFIK